MGGSVKLLLLLLAGALALPATTFYVTVAGLGGEPDYEQRFASWASTLDKTLRENGDAARVITLHGAEATRERLQSVLREVAGRAGADDELVLTLIGHGTFDGYNYKMNLPGPDITAAEIAGLLDAAPPTRQLVANLTSASGGSLEVLRKENRAVITATKSGTERNAVVFARYWVEALETPEADLDKNEVITATEAFRFAARKTTEFYVTQKRLATEHALIEDTGAGEGVREPSQENGRGLLAGQFALLRIGDAQLAARDPAKRELLARKQSIEEQIDTLKYQKGAMPEAEYRQQLTRLLIELARAQAELDKE